MIHHLNGLLTHKTPPMVVIELNGLGYEIYCSMQTIYQLPDVQQAVFLYTHLVVREDAQILYGFFDPVERTLFRQLIKISGVGPKLAIGLLSSITPVELQQCVLNQDAAKLKRLPGIGPKSAQRLLIELKDTFKDWPAPVNTTDAPSTNHLVGEQDALAALVSLGYKPQEASRALAKIKDLNQPVEVIIRLALKEMA